ncbi:terpenoid synthase [Aspergillus heterothallicus]
MPSIIEQSNQDVIWRSLTGQTVSVPNLAKLLPSWAFKIHPEYERARNDFLNPWIRRWVDDSLTSRKLQKAEFGVFAAVLCSDAPFDRFVTVAKYFAWYYIWDDIFDCGALQGSSDSEVSAYRQASMQYIQYQLLPEHECPDLSVYSSQLQNALVCWEEVGKHIREVCSHNTRMILSKAMLEYMEAVGDANALFDNGKFPSLEAYWARRDYAAGIYPGIATIPFVYGVDITPADVSNIQMKELWKSTSYLVHISNDIISLRKELSDGQIENLVPVIMLNESITINEAMQESYKYAKDNVAGMETAARNLQSALGGTPRDQAVVAAFTQGCRDLAAGLIHWSYSGQRYFKSAELDADKVLHFQINRRLSGPVVASGAIPVQG